MVARLMDQVLKKYSLSGYKRDSFITITIQVFIITLKEYFYKIIYINKLINKLINFCNIK